MSKYIFILSFVFIGRLAISAENTNNSVAPTTKGEVSISLFTVIENLDAILNLYEFRTVIVDETTGQEMVAQAEHYRNGKYQSMIIKDYSPQENHKYTLYIYKYYFLGNKRPGSEGLLCSVQLDSKKLASMHNETVKEFLEENKDQPRVLNNITPQSSLLLGLSQETVFNGNKTCQFIGHEIDYHKSRKLN